MTTLPPGSNTAQVFKAQLATLGFNVQLHPVEHAVMYTKFCSVVANEPNVCPNVGWVKDFNDGQAMIDVPFNGKTITGSPTNNSNWPQLNDPTINAALDSAKYITNPTQRAAEYGKIDDMITAQAPALVRDLGLRDQCRLGERAAGDQRVQRSRRPVVHVTEVR